MKGVLERTRNDTQTLPESPNENMSSLSPTSEELLNLLHGTPNKTHAYIIHCKEDAKRAESLRRILSNQSRDLYIHDPEDDKHEKDTVDAVSRARKVVIVVSDAFVQSALERADTKAAVKKIQRFLSNVVLLVCVKDFNNEKLPDSLQACPSIVFDGTDKFSHDFITKLLEDPLPAGTIIQPKSNFGAGFAYAHFYGFYNIVLPGMRKRIRESGLSNEDPDPQKRNMCHKMIVVIPESCYATPDLAEIGGSSISHHCWLPYMVSVAGHKNRDYKSTVYNMVYEQTPGNHRELRFIFETPSILTNLHEMKEARLLEADQCVEEVQQFYYVLRGLINSSEQCRDQVSFIYYKDARGQGEKLDELILDRVQNELFEEAKTMPTMCTEDEEKLGSQLSVEKPPSSESVEKLVESPATESTPRKSNEVKIAITSQQKVIFPAIPGYSLTRCPVGKAVIINIKNFHNKKLERVGADVDEKIMKEALHRLRFHVDVMNDLTASKIIQWVSNYARDELHEFSDAFALVLMSHGRLGKIIGSDGSAVDIVDLTSILAPCETLKKKPKLIFVQACQAEAHEGGAQFKAGDGTKADHVDDVAETQSDATDEEIETISALRNLGLNPNDALDKIGEEIVTDETVPYNTKNFLKSLLVPRHPDFIMSYAALPGMRAYRHTSQGSFYIQALSSNLKEFANAKNFEDILKGVTTTVIADLAKAFPNTAFNPIQIPFHVALTERHVQF